MAVYCPLSEARLKRPLTQIEWVAAQEEPLAIIESVSDDQLVTEVNAVVATNRNPGLAAPQITEVLANPLGTGTDGTEEFIELSLQMTQSLTSLALCCGRAQLQHIAIHSRTTQK